MGNNNLVNVRISASPLEDIDYQGQTFRKGYEYIFEVLNMWEDVDLIYNESELPIDIIKRITYLIKWDHYEFIISTLSFEISQL